VVESLTVKASVRPFEVPVTFMEVRTVLDRESDESGDSGAVLVDDLLNLREILCNELPRPAHSAKWAQEMLLTGVGLDQAEIVDGVVIIEDEV